MGEQNNPILTAIMNILGDSYDEELVEMVLNRLESLSYIVQATDMWAITFTIQKVVNRIKDFCNIDEIPEGLKFVTVDIICGEFLLVQKQTNSTSITENFDVEGAIKQIQLGDTTVSFATDSQQSAEDKLNSLISYLIKKEESGLVCYRKIKW